MYTSSDFQLENFVYLFGRLKNLPASYALEPNGDTNSLQRI